MYLIGLDIGTTGCKAALFDLDGNIKAAAFCEYDVICEKPMQAEQDPNLVWQTTKKVLSETLAKSGVKAVGALSVSVQGDAVIPVDRELNPLHNTLLGMDYRSKPQSARCAEVLGDKTLFQITGMRSHPMNSLTKILWFKDNMPGIYEKAYKFMTYADYLLAKLGARPVIDYTMASRTMAFDLNKKAWSEEILGKMGVDQSLLSEAVPSGRVVGEINPRLAKELGIQKGTLLVSGGHDQTLAAIGAGVVRGNIALDSHGTAEVVSTAFDKPMLSDLMYNSYYPCYCHAVSGMYFTFSLNHVGGILLKWYRDNLGHAEVIEAAAAGKDIYGLIESKAPAGPSSVFVLPHFNGSGTPWCDLDSKGAVLGLTMSTTRHDIVKGILDSLAYEMRINIETMRKAGIVIDNLRAVGGGAKSPLWLQIKADVTGCNVATLKVSEAACLGAAILAGTAAGGYRSVYEGVDKTVVLKDIYEPDPNNQKIFEKKYLVYREIYDTIKKINHKL